MSHWEEISISCGHEGVSSLTIFVSNEATIADSKATHLLNKYETTVQWYIYVLICVTVLWWNGPLFIYINVCTNDYKCIPYFLYTNILFFRLIRGVDEVYIQFWKH